MSSLNRPYEELHRNPQGEGDARPTALQIIQDEDLINKLTDKVVLVTGTSSGIGLETARALHATGAHVLMHVKYATEGESVRQDILATSPGKGKLEILSIDLGSFKSVRDGAAEFSKKSDKLNVLVNNAGKTIHGILFL
jgi:NAD(P)-dependent dehydrogenase (short-subunit alcohol dehydrogenase family)